MRLPSDLDPAVHDPVGVTTRPATDRHPTTSSARSHCVDSMAAASSATSRPAASRHASRAAPTKPASAANRAVTIRGSSRHGSCGRHRRSERRGQRRTGATEATADDEDLDVQRGHGAGEHAGQGVDGRRPHRRRRSGSPSRTRAATSPASTCPPAPAGRRGIPLGDGARRGDRFQRRPRGDEDLADLAGAERRPGWITPSITMAAERPVPIGTNSAEPAPAAAPNVAFGDRAGAHVVADRHRTGRGCSARRSRTGTSRHPIVTERRPTPASSTIPGTATPTPATSRPSSEHSSTRPAATAAMLSSTASGPRCAPARHTPEHAQPSRPEDPRLQRRAADVDGDDRESVDARVTSRCSASRMTLNDSDRGRSGSRPAMAGELDGESLGADEVDHRIEIRRSRTARPSRRRRRPGHSAARRTPTRPSLGPLTLIGPWRYSIAGYDSVQKPAASRHFNAASSAIAAAQPRPRNVIWRTARRGDGEVGRAHGGGAGGDDVGEVLAERGAQQGQDRRREAGLHHRLLGGERQAR